jgi:hypothetical protein
MEHMKSIGLGEAFASYQPSAIDAAAWGRLRPELCQAFAELGYETWSDARPHVSRTVAFMADVLAIDESATLAGSLTRLRVDGYLQRLKDDGVSAGTLANRQGSLNQLLRGERQQRRSPARAADGTAAYTPDEVAEFISAAQPHPRHGPVVEAAFQWDRSATDAAMGSRPLYAAQAWLAREAGLPLDLRRVRQTRVEALVSSSPALEAVGVVGVGRRALTAAALDAALPTSTELKAALRGSTD